MVAPAPARSYVPADLNVADFAQLEPLYRQLLDRPLETASQAQQWLLDFSELSSVVHEYGARRDIDKSCHTDDRAIEQAFLHYFEQIEPRIKPLIFQLQRKLLQSPAKGKLSEARHQLLFRNWLADVALFREQNVALETQITLLNNECDKLNGAMTVNFRGKEYTQQQLARFVEEPDRTTRQQAWEAGARRRLLDRQAIEDLFDQMLPLRQSMAANAGMDNYREFVWKAYNRFDYTPKDCVNFADAVEQTCVPLLRELDRRRKQELGVERLRPWDLTVDPRHRPPLRPVEESNVDGFVEGIKTIFGRLSPSLGDDFQSLRDRGNLDLQSRKGKQPGGYQYSLEESREPFIFMNAAGVQSDLVTLLHEGGHAFHCLAARNEPLIFLRSAPMEFCEVASMSMELLGADHYDVFYPAADAARAKRMQLERVVMLLPWVGDRFIPTLALHASRPYARAAHQPMALSAGPLRPSGGLERP
jgi:oligoendopeptidase F